MFAHLVDPVSKVTYNALKMHILLANVFSLEIKSMTSMLLGAMIYQSSYSNCSEIAYSYSVLV